MSYKGLPLVLTAAFLLASCGGGSGSGSDGVMTGDPLSGFSFDTPPGWTQGPVMSRHRSVFRFFQSPVATSYIMIARSYANGHRNAQLFDRMSPIAICGGHNATFVRRSGKMLSIHYSHQASDMVDSTWGKVRILAYYYFPTGATPDPAAESAIRSVCPNGGG